MVVIASKPINLNKMHFWQECNYPDWKEPIEKIKESMLWWKDIGTPFWATSFLPYVMNIYDILVPYAEELKLKIIGGVKLFDGANGLQAVNDKDGWKRVAKAIQIVTAKTHTKRCMIDMEALVQPILKGDLKVSDTELAEMRDCIRMLPKYKYLWYHGVTGWFDWFKQCKRILEYVFAALPAGSMITGNCFATTQYNGEIGQAQLKADKQLGIVIPHTMWYGRKYDWTVFDLNRLTALLAPYNFWLVYPGWQKGPTVARDIAIYKSEEAMGC